MKRKMSKKSLQNLKKFKKNDEYTKQCSAKGGETQKKNALIRKGMKDWLQENVEDKDFEIIMGNLVERAKIDTKTFEVLRDTLGEKPTNRIEAKFEQPTFIDDLDD